MLPAQLCCLCLQDLAFKAGQVIAVTDQGDGPESWWEGELNGRTGSFPGTFVKSLSSFTSGPKTFTAVRVVNGARALHLTLTISLFAAGGPRSQRAWYVSYVWQCSCPLLHYFACSSGANTACAISAGGEDRPL